MAETFFDLPNNSEEFGIVLEPADLRRIDFSALEFEEMRRAIIEYMQAYYPDQFNDFVANNGIIMIVELVSYLADILAQRSDVIADESFLPTAQTRDAVDQHLQLINNRIQRATPAVVDVEVSIGAPALTAVNIAAGTKFTLQGADGDAVVYEIYRAPNDFTSPITILPGTRGVIAFGIEGTFATPVVFESSGGTSQRINIFDPNVLDDPITVEVTTGSITEEWSRVDVIEKAGPTDKVFEVRFYEERAEIIFGDDRAGRALLAGQTATVNFRVGGGIRGRIQANAINETRPINPAPPLTASVNVLFRNITPSSGGTDQESIDDAKLRAPRESAALQSATSGEDYAVQAVGFTHPVFGSVLKAVASLKTSLNANIVFLHVLAAGPDDIPVLPSIGLKQGLESYFGEIKVLTDEVRVVDGAIKPVDVDGFIVISRNADPVEVKNNVDFVISNFFSVNNFDMGQPLYVSRLLNELQSIDGVRYVRLKEPVDDILSSELSAVTAADNRVGFDELITLGNVNLKIYVEKIRFQ